jgi:GntR family transcriptional regulator/MocR family aminotransferase
MDLDAVERILSTERVSFIYTIPNFQNPTGITTSQAHRERLLSLCQNHRTPLVEDGFEEEMKYFGKAILPIKSMDRGNLVIYLGTFSKILFPGLRVGWVAAESGCIQRLTAIQRFCSLSGNTLGQAAVYYFCARGHYDTHVRRMHRAYRKRLTTLLHGMREYFPARGIEWTEPVGGYTCWVRLPGTTITESELEEQLLSEGVMVTSGSLFCPTPSETLSFRISISDLNENEIETGIRRLGRVLHRITGG